MTYEQAVRDFKETYRSLYIRHADYWTAQLAWAEYTDALCKNGNITQHQYDSWTPPFQYAKHLSPTKAMLEREVNERC